MQLNDSIPEYGDPHWARVAQIPIADCCEALIDVAGLDPRIEVKSAYWRMEFEHALPSCHLRQTVVERLSAAAHALPEGLRLLVLDGWRPVALQALLYDDFSRQVRERFPDLDETAHTARTRQFVAPPSDAPGAPSPHLTGGSVDVTLIAPDGEPLDMGTGFDEPCLLSRTAALESREQADMSAARDNRRMLYSAMINAGFSNLASEWWHFDYGNQLWAWCHEHRTAIYGATSI